MIKAKYSSSKPSGSAKKRQLLLAINSIVYIHFHCCGCLCVRGNIFHNKVFKNHHDFHILTTTPLCHLYFSPKGDHGYRVGRMVFISLLFLQNHLSIFMYIKVVYYIIFMEFLHLYYCMWVGWNVKFWIVKAIYKKMKYLSNDLICKSQYVWVCLHLILTWYCSTSSHKQIK